MLCKGVRETYNSGGGGAGAGGTTSADLYYLHTDHLGKPGFATDEAGAVVWDAGIFTSTNAQ